MNQTHKQHPKKKPAITLFLLTVFAGIMLFMTSCATGTGKSEDERARERDFYYKQQKQMEKQQMEGGGGGGGC